MSHHSGTLFERALRFIPGGVNSPVRAFKAVGCHPLFIRRGLGSKIYDVDGNEYIDYVGSWGPLILGHSHPEVLEALVEATRNGTSYGAPTEIEVKVAESIVDAVPSIEMVRMVNSGTEATMSAIRLARAYTGRDKIIKFAGCYHGHGDSFLIKAGSGATTLGVPSSPGVPRGIAADTLNGQFNNLDSVRQLISSCPEQIAAIIVEPVAGNMGVIPPEEGFLRGLRELCDSHGIILIFDEVMTGFRVALGGAQELYGVEPDLTTLGKIIGGGLPVGAYGGRREIMGHLAPQGPVYQAGTLSGNPLAMTAGYKTLQIVSQDGFYDGLEERSQALDQGVGENIKKLDVPVKHTRVGSMFCLFFTDGEVRDYDTAQKCDTEKFGAYFRQMLKRSIYLAPSQFEANFISAAHSREDIERTVKANYEALKAVFA